MRMGKLNILNFRTNVTHLLALAVRIINGFSFFWLSKTIPIANVDADDNLNIKLISESFKCSHQYSMLKN